MASSTRFRVWSSAASLLVLFVTLFLVSITTTDNGAHALAIPVRLPVPAVSGADASVSAADPAIAFAELTIRDDSDSRKRKREEDSEAEDSESDIDSTVSDWDSSQASSLPDDDSSDDDYKPGGNVPTEPAIGDYERDVDYFLHPTSIDAKEYLKDWDGNAYKIVGNKYLKTRPGLKITGPMDASGKIIQWNYEDIKDTKQVDFEHLVEGHDVSEAVGVLRAFRRGLNKDDRNKFHDIMAKNYKLTFKITLNGKTTEKEFTGTFERLLGEALNGVGNGELMINSLNTLKYHVVSADAKSKLSEGEAGFAGLLAYLTEFDEKIGNSVENIISVFEGIHNAINSDPGLQKKGFTQLATSIEKLRNTYGKSAIGAPNKLLVKARLWASKRLGQPMSDSLKAVVVALNAKTAPAPGPLPKPLTTSAAASAKACGSSSFARGFEGSPVAHLSKRAFGCDAGVLVDENGEAVDEFGNNFNYEDQPVNEDGDLVDESNNAIDRFGNKLDENGEPRNAQGLRIDSEGNVDADQSPRQPSLRCSGGSASACRSKQRTLRKNQKPGSKDNARGIEDDEAEIYSEAKGDINRDTASTLASMKAITGDANILPIGEQGFDVDNPKFIFGGAETLDAAWESVGKSFESAISSLRKRMVNRSAIKKTLRNWRRNIAQRIQRETTQPRAERDGLKVSENERQASVFNSALDNYNAHEPNDPVLAVYNSDTIVPVALEAFPDTLGDSIRSSDETASRAGLDALREFSDLTDGAILPEGAEGLILTVDESGALDDAIDPSEGIIAGAGEGSSAPIESWDQAWERVASVVNDYLEANKENLNSNKIRALLRGLKALKKAGNSKKGSSKGENKARHDVWDKASEIVRKAVQGELGKEKTVVELVKDADDPVLAGNNDGPTDGIKASHIAEDVGGSMAEAGDRIIGDRMASLMKTKLGLNARKLARSFKNVAKTIGKNLAKSGKLTPEAKAELQSNMAALKGFRDEQVNKIAGTPESDRAGMLEECEFTLDIHNAYNEVATNAILGDAQQVTDSSQGVTTDFTSVDLPDGLATMADAIGAKHELQALGDLNAVDPTIGLAGGYSPEVTNSGAEPAIGGIGEYVRELTPKEIANVADGATVEDAWNSVTEKAMTVSGASTRFLKHPRFTRARNALRRGLKNLKKGLNLREKGQKALAPSDRKDAPAMRAETMRANVKDMSQRARTDLGVSGETSPLSAGSGSSNELTNEDLRSADTVISVGIVDALGDLKLDGEASGILPGGDIPASDDPGATIEAPMLFRGANTMDDVLQGTSDEVGQELGFNSKTMSALNKVKALRGLSKLAKMAKAAKKDVVAGVGRESSGALSGAIQALGTLERSAGGVAAGAERGDTAQGLDLPAMDIEPVASNSFDVNTPTKLTTLAEAHPGSRATTRSWNSRLKNVRNRMLKSATGRALKTGKGNTAGKP